MNESLIENENGKRGKEELLNDIINDLMSNCDSILAIIIADWQGLSYASKLPDGVNEEVISATTILTLEGTEGTRKELEKSLLGNKLSYLIIVTEDDPAYMIIFPIETLGYIACVSKKREDMGIIIQNTKSAAKKVLEILMIKPTQKKEEKSEYIEQYVTEKYENLLDKLKNLKTMVPQTTK